METNNVVHLDKILTVEETAKELCVAVGTLNNWRYRKQGPPYKKAGRLVRYKLKEVRRWLDQNGIDPEAA